MKVYVVYKFVHRDTYQTSESYASILKVFRNHIDAYEYAVEFLKNDFVDSIHYSPKLDDVKNILNSDFFFDTEKYEYIHRNLHEIIGDGKFTLLPTHTICFVEEMEVN